MKKITNNSQPLTTKIFLEVLKDLRENVFSQFATKEDVKVIVRDELKGYATKEEVRTIIQDELKGYATKDNIEKLATKEDLEEFREETKGNFQKLFDVAFETGETLHDHEKRIEKLEAVKN